jgi:hypothetical protein
MKKWIKQDDAYRLEKEINKETMNQRSNGITPLIYCIEFRAKRCLRWLIENGADPNLVWHNKTTLQHTIRRRQWDLDMIELFIQLGANPLGILGFISPYDHSAEWKLVVLLMEYGVVPEPHDLQNNATVRKGYDIILLRQMNCNQGARTFLGVMKRMGICKDMRRMIGKMVWQTRKRKEWE